MPRAGVNVPQASGNRIPWFYFVRFDLGSTYRYTTCPIDATLSIDGGSHTWTTYPMKVENLSQTSQSPLDISYISIGNLNQAWNLIAFGPSQFRELPVLVWLVQFDPTDFDNGVLTVVGSPEMFVGRTAGADMGKDGWLKITLNPHVSSWNTLALTIINPNCRYVYKDGDTCQYVGVLPSCLRTRSDCNAHGNLARFGGSDFMPSVDVSLQWGQQALNLSNNPLGPDPNTPADPPPAVNLTPLAAPRMRISHPHATIGDPDHFASDPLPKK